MITAVKDLFRRLDRHRGFRALALGAVRAMNWLTFRILGRQPAVAQVYVKGSFVRGPFYPLSSDLDLALILRSAALVDPVPDLRRFFDAFRLVRRTNLSVRDWWQHVFLDDEMEIVRRYWYLAGCDEWRDERGEAPSLTQRPADSGLLALAHWYQQCAWSASAVQKHVDPAAPFHQFRAGIKKTAFLATRLPVLARCGAPSPRELFALRREHSRRFDDGWRSGRDAGSRSALSDLLVQVRDLESNGRLLLESGLADGAGTGEREATSDLDPPWPVELEPLRRLSGCSGLVRSEQSLHLILRDGASDEEIAAILLELRQIGAGRRPLTYLVPARALPIWPMACTRERLVVWKSRLAPAAARGPATESGFQRRLLLFESIFLPSTLRLALSFADRDARLLRHVWTLARAVLLYEQGRYRATRDRVAADLLDAPATAPAPPAELRRVLTQDDEGAAKLGTETLFRAGAALATRLYAALASDPDATPEPSRPAIEVPVG